MIEIPLFAAIRRGVPTDHPCGWCPSCNGYDPGPCQQPGVTEIDMGALAAALPAGYEVHVPDWCDPAQLTPGLYGEVMRTSDGARWTVGGGYIVVDGLDRPPRELLLAICDIRRCSNTQCEEVLLSQEQGCPSCGLLGG